MTSSLTASVSLLSGAEAERAGHSTAWSVTRACRSGQRLKHAGNLQAFVTHQAVPKHKQTHAQILHYVGWFTAGVEALSLHRVLPTERSHPRKLWGQRNKIRISEVEYERDMHFVHVV